MHCTSASTSRPAGVELTGRVLVATTKSCRESQGARDDAHNGSKTF